MGRARVATARSPARFAIGDIGYADDSFLHGGCYAEFCYEEAFDEFMGELEPIADSTAFMTAPGNHEVFTSRCLQRESWIRTAHEPSETRTDGMHNRGKRSYQSIQHTSRAEQSGAEQSGACGWHRCRKRRHPSRLPRVY